MNRRKKVIIAPSLICMDMCNLEEGIREIESAGIEMLHVDIIDGYFSPSMPLGLGTVEMLRKKTGLPFDVHIMAKDNEFFINELIDIGVQQICFHYESAIHVNHYLDKIRDSGARAGLALTPSTPVSVLEYAIQKCDFILLMLINPGFARYAGEKQVPYARTKIEDAYRFIQRKGLDVAIEIDGRITKDNVEGFVAAGADIIVAGSSSLFDKAGTLEENFGRIMEAANKGINRRYDGRDKKV